MNIVSQVENLPAFDGTVLLRICIDMPSDNNDPAENYLSQFSKRCYDFAKSSLFPHFLKQYNERFPAQTRVHPYRYVFSISETFSKDAVKSYLLRSCLTQYYATVAMGVSSVIFNRGVIVPPNLICNKRDYNNKSIFLDKDGTPSIAFVSGNEINIKKINKYSCDFIK